MKTLTLARTLAGVWNCWKQSAVMCDPLAYAHWIHAKAASGQSGTDEVANVSSQAFLWRETTTVRAGRPHSALVRRQS